MHWHGSPLREPMSRRLWSLLDVFGRSRARKRSYGSKIPAWRGDHGSTHRRRERFFAQGIGNLKKQVEPKPRFWSQVRQGRVKSWLLDLFMLTVGASGETFAPINCGALTEELLNSELLDKKGAPRAPIETEKAGLKQRRGHGISMKLAKFSHRSSSTTASSPRTRVQLRAVMRPSR